MPLPEEQFDNVAEDIRIVVERYLENVNWYDIRGMYDLYDKYPELTNKEWGDVVDWVISGISV